jgi:hypothetical protein
VKIMIGGKEDKRDKEGMNRKKLELEEWRIR